MREAHIKDYYIFTRDRILFGVFILMEYNNPKISIIVIAYNNEDYLPDCLHSVVTQIYNNYEVIFIDDGSQDDTYKIAKQYEEEYSFFSAYHKENGGIVSARIEGVKHATGLYVMFVDGDDWISDNMLMHLSAGIDDNEGVIDIVISNVIRQNNRKQYVLMKSNYSKNRLTGNEFFSAIMQDQLLHYMVAKLYRKDFLNKADYTSYPHVTVAEDLMSNSFFGIFEPNVRLIDVADYYYRFNTKSCTRDGSERLLEQVSTLYKMDEFFADKGVAFAYKDLINYQWFSYLFGYISDFEINPYVKNKMVKMCSERIQNWKKNKYCQTRYKRRTLDRLSFDVYTKVPFLGPLYQMIVKFALLCYHRCKSIKNIS